MLDAIPNMFPPSFGDGDDSSARGQGKGKLTDSDREQIAVDIRRYLKVQLSSTRRSLSAAYRIGAMLNMVHDSLNHGEWMPWLEKNTRIKIRTANQWRSLADHRDLVIFGMRNKLTITDVLNQISELKTAKPHSAGSEASGSKAAVPIAKVVASRTNAKLSMFAVDHLRSLCELLQDAPNKFPDDIHAKLVPLIERFVSQVDKILGGEA